MANEIPFEMKRSVVGGGLTTGGTTESVLCSGGVFFKELVSSGTWEYDVSILVGRVQIFGIVASKDCTIKTNNNGDPDDTLNMLAGVPKIWRDGDDATFFLTTNVTALFVTATEDTLITLSCGYLALND